MFADSELQPWNNGETKGTKDEEEALSTREMVSIVKTNPAQPERTETNGTKR